MLVRSEIAAHVSGTHLFLRKPWSKSDNIHNIALYNAHVREMTAPKSVQFFAFTFALLLLLRQAFVTTYDTLAQR